MWFHNACPDHAPLDLKSLSNGPTAAGEDPLALPLRNTVGMLQARAKELLACQTESISLAENVEQLQVWVCECLVRTDAVRM